MRASMGSLVIGLTVASGTANADLGLQDPTQPLQESSGKKGVIRSVEFVVDSILVSKRRRIAVINGEMLVEGDTVDGFKVIAINPASVDVGKDGRRWTLAAKTATGIALHKG